MLHSSRIVAFFMVFCLVGCAGSGESLVDGDFYSSEDIEIIERCLTSTVEEPRDLVDQPAELIGGLVSLHHALRFPPEARHTSGRVIVQFTVTEEGQVVAPEVLQSPHPALAESASHAVCLAQFEPAIHEGEAIAQQMAMPINFERADFDLLIEEQN